MFEKEDMLPKYGFTGRRIGSQCAACKKKEEARRKQERLSRVPS